MMWRYPTGIMGSYKLGPWHMYGIQYGIHSKKISPQITRMSYESRIIPPRLFFVISGYSIYYPYFCEFTYTLYSMTNFGWKTPHARCTLLCTQVTVSTEQSYSILRFWGVLILLEWLYKNRIAVERRRLGPPATASPASQTEVHTYSTQSAEHTVWWSGKRSAGE